MNEGDAMEAGTGAAATAIKGGGAILALAGGITVNQIQSVNVWLQFVSLLLGIGIALATMWSFWRKKK